MTTKEQQQLCDPRYGKTGQCIAPEIVRHEDKRYNPPRYVFTFLCNDPENCPEFFNETRQDHHYGCECEDCVEDYRRLKG